MNCLAFQRELNADPRHLSAPARAHAESCADCARRREAQLRAEARWAAELEVEPPMALEDRILLAARLDQRKRRGAFAVAATLVVGVALAVALNVSQPARGPQDLVALSVAHVLDEPEHLLETRPVDPATLNGLLARVGARASGALPVTYANACPLPNGPGGHIVLSTRHGRVTLMLIPNGVTEATVRKTTSQFIVEVHAARRGSYSLVAASDAALAEVKTLLARQVRWT